MGHFYFLLSLGALLLLALGLSLHRRFGRRGRFPYVGATTLFAPRELALLAALETALGPDYRVFGRVRAVDVIGLHRRLDRATRRRALTHLWAHRFDFLVCTARGNQIAAAVNLAPVSRFGRPPARGALDRLCAAAGLPFVRVREADAYDPGTLAGLLHTAMARHPPAPARAAAAPPDAPPERAPEPTTQRLTAVSLEDAREPRLRPFRPPPAPAAAAPGPTPGPAMPAPMPESAPKSAPKRVLPAILAEPPPRREPTLAPDGDLDPGPAFHIGGQLGDEDDRPRRAGGGSR